MATEKYIDDVLNRISRDLDIGDDLFKQAEDEYRNLGKWIAAKVDEEGRDYKVDIFPQGSMALGTVVRPLPVGNKDADFDLDWVLAFQEEYGLDAMEMKCGVVKPWLDDYLRENRYGCNGGKIEEKRRCWHVENNAHPGFHTDVVPGCIQENKLLITDKREPYAIYRYIRSDPKEYQKWFFERCEIRRKALLEEYNRAFRADAKIEKLKRHKLKTPLQKAIQILKRYRDVEFESKDEKSKPVSIIITTLAAKSYDNGESILDAIGLFLGKANQYIQHRGNQYFIADPCNPEENLANKWNQHPERVSAFYYFLQEARKDFDREKLKQMDMMEIAAHLKKVLGEKVVVQVYNEMAEENKRKQEQGILKVDSKKGTISPVGSIVVPAVHHYGT